MTIAVDIDEECNSHGGSNEENERVWSNRHCIICIVGGMDNGQGLYDYMAVLLIAHVYKQQLTLGR